MLLVVGPPVRHRRATKLIVTKLRRYDCTMGFERIRCYKSPPLALSDVVRMMPNCCLFRSGDCWLLSGPRN